MYSYEYPHPAVTTDIAVFAVRDNDLQVLLIKRGAEPHLGAWALPGGFVNIDEDLEDGARRELEEETGVTGVSLEQLHTFGHPDRDPRERVITVVYYTLIDADDVSPRASTDADDAAWFSMDDLPELAFDHHEILAMARQRIQAEAALPR